MNEIFDQFPSTKEGLHIEKIVLHIGKLNPSILQLFSEIVESYLKLCNTSSSQSQKTKCSSLLGLGRRSVAKLQVTFDNLTEELEYGWV